MLIFNIYKMEREGIENLKKIFNEQKDVFVAISQILECIGSKDYLDKNLNEKFFKEGPVAVDKQIKELYKFFMENNVNYPGLETVKDYVNKYQN